MIDNTTPSLQEPSSPAAVQTTFSTDSTLWPGTGRMSPRLSPLPTQSSQSPSLVSNPWPMGCTWPRMAMNVAQYKIVNLHKAWDFFLWLCVTMSHKINVRTLSLFICLCAQYLCHHYLATPAFVSNYFQEWNTLSKIRTKISDEHLENSLRVAATSIKPDIDALVSQIRCQKSH